jgi:hypothetical protein
MTRATRDATGTKASNEREDVVAKPSRLCGPDITFGLNESYNDGQAQSFSFPLHLVPP